ncbi:hypothetical protein Aperf_G00000078112 [Anoplocephala perfoliata]
MFGDYMLSGISPFAGDSQVETFQNILECSVTFDREEFADVSHEARDFISRLLRKNPRKRDSASECLRHPWVLPVIRQLTGEPEVIQKIDLSGITSSRSPQITANNGSDNDKELKKQIHKQNVQDHKKADSSHPHLIQKVNVNGILQPQVHSSSSSSNTSPKFDQNNSEISSISKPLVTEREATKDEGKTLVQEPQIIQKIDLNGVLPSMGSHTSSSQNCPERNKRKSLSSQASTESQTGSDSNSIYSGPSRKIGSEVVHKHKVVQVHETFTKQPIQTSKEPSRKPSRPEAGLPSQMADLQVSNTPINRKSSGDSIFGRASKWLEATNNAFDKKFRPTSTSNSATSNSFHRARNAFINKNSLAERKLVFTRVRLAGDMDQALPGFKWRVLPAPSTTCEHDINHAS